MQDPDHPQSLTGTNYFQMFLPHRQGKDVSGNVTATVNSQGPPAPPRRITLEPECDADPSLPFLSLLPTVRAFCKKNKALPLEHDFSLLRNTLAGSTANPSLKHSFPRCFPAQTPRTVRRDSSAQLQAHALTWIKSTVLVENTPSLLPLPPRALLLQCTESHQPKTDGTAGLKASF